MNRNAAAALLVLVLLAPVSLYAKNGVDCSKGDSINAELAKLTKSGPNVMTIAGSCAEDVVIDGFDDLTLVAAAGASLNLASATSKSVLLVNSSRKVVIDGFAINIPAPAPGNPFPWVVEFNGSVGCVMKNLSVTGGGGIRLQRSSYVTISDSTLHDVSIGAASNRRDHDRQQRYARRARDEQRHRADHRPRQHLPQRLQRSRRRQ